MAHRVPITIRLDHFEGPLDLLLYLIQSHELDVSQVSISRITDQYLAYVQLMQDLNFEIASDFLVMAATLVYWKSRAILPKEEDEQDTEEDSVGLLSQDDLIRQLLEHRRYLAAGQEIGRMPRLGDKVFSRPNKRPPTERIWRNMDITGLGLSYQDCLVRQKKRSKILRKETVSLTSKLQFFSERLTVGQATDLRNIMEKNPSIGEQVVTFLASLELGKMKKLKLHQQVNYDPIYVELVEKFSSIDLEITSALEEANRQTDDASSGGEVFIPESPPDPHSKPLEGVLSEGPTA